MIYAEVFKLKNIFIIIIENNKEIILENEKKNLFIKEIYE